MHLDLAALDDHARGCAILGTGGGGDTYASVLAARAALEGSGPVEVVALESLADDALILPMAGWGAPTVGIEKLASGDEGATLVRMAERWFDRKVDALMIGEIGGGNGVDPVGWAARSPKATWRRCTLPGSTQRRPSSPMNEATAWRQPRSTRCGWNGSPVRWSSPSADRSRARTM